jgi:hypothetical protein
MRKVLFLLFLFPGVLRAQNHQETVHPAVGGVSGRWVVNTDFYGATIYFRMELDQEGEKLRGNFDGDKLEGTVKGNSIYFLAKDEQGGTDEGKGTLQDGTITGTVVFTHREDPTHPETHKFAAELVHARRGGAPQHHEFVPGTFYRQFSATNKPVLTIAPGDSVHTTTVDAGGTDEKSVTRVLGGNPETGPFYVAGGRVQVDAVRSGAGVGHVGRIQSERSGRSQRRDSAEDRQGTAEITGECGKAIVRQRRRDDGGYFLRRNVLNAEEAIRSWASAGSTSSSFIVGSCWMSVISLTCAQK